jgi:hypothetical protein
MKRSASGSDAGYCSNAGSASLDPAYKEICITSERGGFFIGFDSSGIFFSNTGKLNLFCSIKQKRRQL